MEQTESPHVVIVAGPNGAGKSTAAPRLLRDYLGITEFVNADVIAQGMSGFRPETVALQASRLMLARLRELAAERVCFAFETTLAAKSYANWLKELHESGYQSHLVFLWIRSPEIAVERVAERVRQGGHDIPEETIRRRYQRGLANLIDLYIPIVHDWVVLDNSDSSGYHLIASQIRGNSVQVANKPLWNRIEKPYK